MRLADDIIFFLESNGFECSRQIRDGSDIIVVTTPDKKKAKVIFPLEASADSVEEAVRASNKAYDCTRLIRTDDANPLLIITEDRWYSQQDMTKSRLLAHLEVFEQIYARNCEVRRIEKREAQEFLERSHSYGDASCRYRYGLFLKRHTGHNAGNDRSKTGCLVAVATFSNARKWIKKGKEIRSYEWTRYASLPHMRINGGMGKFLKVFIEEIKPDDIMSYADLEWSEGDVYKRLGFKLEGFKEPVTFAIDTTAWTRAAINKIDTPVSSQEGGGGRDVKYFRNLGSNKYRLKLTEYE
ncbi:MAG: hypothetical protein J6V17_04430 [Bacteroidales bacterium]|nr:hypothetical protein [Bacteroidales bacterium]